MHIDDRYEIGDPNRYNPDFTAIDNLLKSLKDNFSDEVLDAKKSGYNEGFETGFTKGFQLGNSNVEIKDIDYDSIKAFAGWCYVHGIDFSYMAKGTDTVPFTTRVINKFKEEMEKGNKK